MPSPASSGSTTRLRRRSEGRRAGSGAAGQHRATDPVASPFGSAGREAFPARLFVVGPAQHLVELVEHGRVALRRRHRSPAGRASSASTNRGLTAFIRARRVGIGQPADARPARPTRGARQPISDRSPSTSSSGRYQTSASGAISSSSVAAGAVGTPARSRKNSTKSVSVRASRANNRCWSSSSPSRREPHPSRSVIIARYRSV